MRGEHVQVCGEEDDVVVTRGSAGLATQVCGGVSTVSGLARATGGIGGGRLVEREVG